ncbi:MAG: hypothetical protein ACMUEM_07195 [Flavobacteriales bacterium AspAUS03]
MIYIKDDYASILFDVFFDQDEKTQIAWIDLINEFIKIVSNRI